MYLPPYDFIFAQQNVSNVLFTKFLLAHSLPDSSSIRFFELLKMHQNEEGKIKSEDVTVLGSPDAWLDRETILIVIIG